MTSVTVTGEANGQRAASYLTLTGARLAAMHLLETGFDRDLAVVPRNIVVVTEPRLARRRAIALRSGAVTGATVGVAAGLTTSPGLAVSAIASWLALGTFVGLATGAVLSALDRRTASDRERAPERVVPTRFDVVCSDRVDHAEHLLARWWDPMAPPSRHVGVS